MTFAATAHAVEDDCPNGSYRAESGHCVESPDDNTEGATALCNNGIYSHSEHPHFWGTCSSHGGVDKYLDDSRQEKANWTTSRGANESLVGLCSVNPKNGSWRWMVG